jgi:hypothetical protein
VIFLGDSNSHTRTQPVLVHDITADKLQLHELDLGDYKINRYSTDSFGFVKIDGRNLLELGDSINLYIMNGISCSPRSSEFTCFPHRGGTSVVGYVLSTFFIIPSICDFQFFDHHPLVNHT